MYICMNFLYAKEHYYCLAQPMKYNMGWLLLRNTRQPDSWCIYCTKPEGTAPRAECKCLLKNKTTLSILILSLYNNYVDHPSSDGEELTEKFPDSFSKFQGS